LAGRGKSLWLWVCAPERAGIFMLQGQGRGLTIGRVLRIFRAILGSPGSDAKQTRFVIDLDRAIPVSAFALADPTGCGVDIPPSISAEPGVGTQGAVCIKEFRYGLSCRADRE